MLSFVSYLSKHYRFINGNAMPQAQDYIDALRNHDYFKVLELADFVNNKYAGIKQEGGGEAIGADELVQLTIYELCQTDINAEDIEKIRFLFSYISYHNSLAIGPYGFKAVSFAMPVSFALAAKNAPGFAAAMATVEINNKQEFKNFLKNESPFSTFLNQVNYDNEYGAITSPLSEEALVEYVATMPAESFMVFQTNINALANEDIIVDCPIIKTIETRDTVKNTIDALLRHLETKLASQGVIDAQKSGLSVKQEKLLNRYSAVYDLRDYCKDKLIFSEEDRAKVQGVLSVCLENDPSWFERTLIDKISDVLSLGLKPIYRCFFSVESNYRKTLDDKTQTNIVAPTV
ncbi:hypothetical protein BN59_03307 [Legionella massiliensis]|uniref:Lpg0393-like VPS9-like domain-containing protein n=1 Tax=Legionella massiliensis TaxID=1034943 RepID=A0A078L190_9GAMM|nr:hypothetical protein [Legionella massiliensis]CDZ78992.1 hypothetical protein BN59_03307 [Legionella massiliensis]CEE14730.1 hypothetical protein BN1094_03307 [Legionella massiliensis]